MEWNIYLLLCVVMNTVCFIQCHSFVDSKTLYEEFVRFYRNDGLTLANLIPNADQSDPLEVLLTMSLYSIDEFNIDKGHISLTGSIIIEWDDQTMAANSGQLTNQYSKDGFEGFSIWLSPKDVWVPSLQLSNGVIGVKNIGDETYKVRYHVFDGRMMWHPKVNIRITCTSDMTYYPFDQHTCSFNVTSWDYKSNEVLLDLAQSDWYLCEFRETGVWSLVETGSRQFVQESQSYVTFYFSIKRYSSFHVLNVMLPVLFLAILNSVVFLIPLEGGQRNHFASMCFLASLFMLQTTLSFVPQTAQPLPLLCIYLLLTMIICSLTCVISVAMFRLNLKPCDENPPNWLQRTVNIISCRRLKKVYRRCINRHKVEDRFSGIDLSTLSISFPVRVLAADWIYVFASSRVFVWLHTSRYNLTRCSLL